VDFTGKMALIIGDGGIGRSATLGFAAGDVRVMAVDHDEAAGEASVGVVRQQGGEALFTRADVSRAAEVQHDVQATLDAWGRIDCFFNNAGIEGKIAATPDYDDDMFDRVIAVNLRGVPRHEARAAGDAAAGRADGRCRCGRGEPGRRHCRPFAVRQEKPPTSTKRPVAAREPETDGPLRPSARR
jgi:NAD(P)-dependent dehydrogenase (short-subunit alcohol dehydrogenase family)